MSKKTKKVKKYTRSLKRLEVERKYTHSKRNFRIVCMIEDGKSRNEVAYILNQEAGKRIITPQRVAEIYTRDKGKFVGLIEKDGTIIH